MDENTPDPTPAKRAYVRPDKPFSQMSREEIAEFAENFRQQILANKRASDGPSEGR